MYSLLRSRAYEAWAPLVARLIFAAMFLMGAAFKIPGTPGFYNEVGISAQAGLPFATIFVALAFLLEVSCAFALIVGWHTRMAAALLAVFTLGLALVFYTNFSDPTIMGQFVSHLGLIAGLLYVSVYGAHSYAAKRD